MQSSPELESAFSQVRLRTSESQPTLETEKNGALPTSLAPFQPMIQGCGAGQRQPGAQRRGANSKLTGRMRPLGPTAITVPPSLQGGTFKCTKGPANSGHGAGAGVLLAAIWRETGGGGGGERARRKGEVKPICTGSSPPVISGRRRGSPLAQLCSAPGCAVRPLTSPF